MNSTRASAIGPVTVQAGVTAGGGEAVDDRRLAVGDRRASVVRPGVEVVLGEVAIGPLWQALTTIEAVIASAAAALEIRDRSSGLGALPTVRREQPTECIRARR